MTMMTRKYAMCGLLCLLSCDFLSFVHSALSIPEVVLTVKERESRQLELNTLPITCTDTDNDTVRVYRQSIYPTNPCGNCFPIWPCSSGTGYCVMYTPSVGTLNYQVATQYTLVVVCTDDKGEDFPGTVDVRLEPNSPPAFINPSSSFTSYSFGSTKTKIIGEVIYDVNANDTDGDGIFYTMTSSPASNRFEIGYGSGIIRAAADLRFQCDPSVTFSVYASDHYNPSVGPSVITTTFSGINLRPVVTNLNTTVKVAEGSTVSYSVAVTDADKYNAILYTVRASPEEGLDYYSVDNNGKVTTRKALDYEYTPLRTVTLYFDISDGFCKAPTSWLTIQITDVNERPKIIPNDIEITVYEGFINIDQFWKVVDPDENEYHTWSRTSTSSDLDVDDDTGSIFSKEEIDIDPNVKSKLYNLKVRVTDKGGLTADAIARITVLDKNDNEPIFDKAVFDVSANECTKPGTILSKVTATDRDSSFQGNDRLFYSGTGRYISVMSDGSVVLTSQCTAGINDDTLAHVTDQGQYPGPLTGVPATVTFSCSPCPTPPEPITTTTTAATSTTYTTSIYTSNTKNGFLDNLAWLVPAILLGIVLLSTLLYLLWRYCSAACTRCCLRRELLKTSPKVQNVNVKPNEEPNVKPKTSVEKKEELPPPPPEPPQLPEEPFLFGFWKETYTDRNQINPPSHTALPASVAKDDEVAAIVLKEEMAEKEAIARERQEKIAKYEKEVNEYNEKIIGVGTQPSPKPPKRKVCNIL
ncbi:protocadherin-like protein [Pomacea canaliculata]|uniref:protocadherin-like protein n=1 Tax=Pomacea canaliculata TaxID=400727 RepID=UPI000D73315E|nr:protocadherin-like protein [Pomacea canaliculata]